MQISCSICRYGELHDYLNRYYCRNKKCYKSGCFDQPESFNCPYGELKSDLKKTILKPSETKTTYKIFEVTYNNVLSVLYIATSEEEVKANCKEYQIFLEYQKLRGGDILIKETKGLKSIYIENLEDFNMEVKFEKKGR